MTNRFHFFIHNYSKVFGGQERYVETLSQSLRNRGFIVNVVGGPERIVQTSTNAKKATLRNSVEILNGNRSLYLQAWRSRKTAIRVYVQHSNVEDGQQAAWRRFVRKALLKLLLKRMDAVVRVSNVSLPNGYAPGKISTIYNGVDLPDFHSARRANANFTLLMVGAVNENKNQKLAINLLTQCQDIKLVIVGDGPQLEEWKRFARDMNIDDRVTWAGFVADPSVYYKTCDALLLLSKFEAFPYAVLEAMSYGMPVISAPVGGVPEAFEHEKSGILLNGYDLDELQERVEALRDNPETRVMIGISARRRIEERFTVEKMTENLLKLIYSLETPGDHIQ